VGSRSRRRSTLLIVLPLAAAAAAVFLLVRMHAGVLEVARGGRGPELRSAEERRAMLADGWCAVSRRERRIVGRLDAGHAPGRPAPGGLYPVQRTDVRASERVDSARVWILPCPQARRGDLPADPASDSSSAPS
jgi:hypothetical protein